MQKLSNTKIPKILVNFYLCRVKKSTLAKARASFSLPENQALEPHGSLTPNAVV